MTSSTDRDARRAAVLTVERAGGNIIKAIQLWNLEGQSEPGVLEELIVLLAKEVARERPGLKDDFSALMDECRRRVRVEAAKLRRPQ
jgi:hypothetical protein